MSAVAAAAAAAALTASRLGASPKALADAVAAAVHNVWRWATPMPDNGVHVCPVVELGADSIESWFADAGGQNEPVSEIAACVPCEDLANESLAKDLNKVTLEMDACVYSDGGGSRGRGQSRDPRWLRHNFAEGVVT